MLGLNRIRDKTHFHLDRVGLDQDKIWEEANITGHQLATALDDAYSILCEIYLQLHGIHRERVDYYDGSDAKVISKRAMFGD